MYQTTRRRFMLNSALACTALVTGGASAAEPAGQAMAAGKQPVPPALKGKKMKTRVSIRRDNLVLAGSLFLPANFDKNARYKAILVTGSFSSVKEQMGATYAAKFAENGYVALTIDYSHYGESEGQPREYESPDVKLSDLKAAVTYLTELPYVQGIGMVGVCTSAGNAAYLAADDKRVKALATVAGFLPDAGVNQILFGSKEEIDRRRELGAAAKLAFEQTGEQRQVPAYSSTDNTAVNFNPAGGFDYYFDKNRGGIPEWKNAFAVMSYQPWFTFDPVSRAASITIPTLSVHSDGCAFPDQIKRFHSQLAGVKAYAWGDGVHFDYYDAPAQVDYAVKNVTEFFNQHIV